MSTTNRQPAAVLHDLLTAGTFIGFYTDPRKVAEFAASAINSIPGVEHCTIQLTVDTPDGSGAPERTSERYAVEIQSTNTSYGWVIVEIEDHSRFTQFQTAIHNFSNTMAMRLENLEYRASLEEQVRDQTKALELNRAFLESIFEYTGDAISVLDRDGNTVRANHTVRELLLQRSNGASSSQNALPSGEPLLPDQDAADCSVQKAFETGTVHTTIAPFPGPDEPQRWFAVSAFPITDRSGNVVNVIQSGRDITDLKKLQDNLTQAVEEKELLLKEVHHRVKNNLNMVISVLNLQFAPFEDERVDDALTASVERIQSMAMVHQFLYQSDSQRTIDLQPFLDRLITELADNYVAGTSAEITAHIANVQIGTGVAVPISLIVNELVTNALKYAFSPQTAGTIDVSCHANDAHELILTVTDNGGGLPAGFDLDRSESLGMRLVQGLSEQLNGTVVFTSPFPGTDAPGTRCTVRVPLA